MVIIRFPKDMDAFSLRVMRETFQAKNPEERFIFLAEGIDVIELPLKDLYKLRDTIDKEISEREMLVPGERNEL